MKTDSLLQLKPSEKFQKDSSELKDHIEKNVLQWQLPSRPSSTVTMDSDVESQSSPLLHRAAGTALLVTKDYGSDFDDFISPISTEAYVEWRLRPLLARLRASTPKLSQELIAMEITIFLLATIGTLLAAMNFRDWIPVSVSLGSALNAFVHYRGLQPRLEASNASIARIQGLLTYWSGLSVVDRRMPVVKQRIVQTVEMSVMQEVAARAPGSAVFGSTVREGKEDALDEEEQATRSKENKDK